MACGLCFQSRGGRTLKQGLGACKILPRSSMNVRCILPKVLELQSSFNKQKRPIYIERNEVISKIPNFWFTAFQHHPEVHSFLGTEDESIFKHVTSLLVDEKENVKNGYKITMVLFFCAWSLLLNRHFVAVLGF